METLAPIPEVGKEYSFFLDGRVKEEDKYLARVLAIYPFEATAKKMIYKYDDVYEEVIPNPLMDLWLEAVMDVFWILSEQTDYIVELHIPILCPQNVYVARTVDGGWHAFETTSSRQFGILDVTGELTAKLQEDLPE